MLLDDSVTAKKAFFLLGNRVHPGSVQSDDGSGQRVAVVVKRDVLGYDGTVQPLTDVLLEDQPLKAVWKAGPFLYESEMAPYKPVPDVVVLDTLEHMVGGTPGTVEDAETGIAASNFGSVAVARGTGSFGQELLPLRFGWLSRLAAPRLGMAGDALNFRASETQVLPVGFRNSFFNGRPLGTEALFSAGDRLRFTDTANLQRTVRITLAPVLRIEDGNGAPLQPPVQLLPQADTVILDRVAETFTIVWRAVLPWQERFAAATLVVQ